MSLKLRCLKVFAFLSFESTNRELELLEVLLGADVSEGCFILDEDGHRDVRLLKIAQLDLISVTLISFF